MAAYQGTYYAPTFLIKDSAGAAVDITGWTFRAMFRGALADEDELFELTTGDGFTITDAPAGELLMEISTARTLLLPVGKVVFDVLRTDGGDGDVFLFSGKLRVKRPVTRDE